MNREGNELLLGSKILIDNNGMRNILCFAEGGE